MKAVAVATFFLFSLLNPAISLSQGGTNSNDGPDSGLSGRPTRPASTAILTEDKVPLYSKPAVRSRIVAFLKKHEPVVVEMEIEQSDEAWCGVTVDGGKGEEGYVQCRYLYREKVQKKNWRTVGTTTSTRSQTVRYSVRGALNIKFVTLEIDGIPIEAAVDTGASVVVFSSDAVKKLGITEFKKKIRLQSANGMTDAFLFELPSIRLGTLEADNVLCAYSPNTTVNLLGGTFLSHFNYSVDENERTITFTPK